MVGHASQDLKLGVTQRLEKQSDESRRRGRKGSARSGWKIEMQEMESCDEATRQMLYNILFLIYKKSTAHPYPFSSSPPRSQSQPP